MLYVDGMNGVMKHSPTIQWLYTLIASKYRLVVKTALKLLLVFVEYCEGNCYLLVNAIRTVDSARGSLPWTNIMKWVSRARTSLIWFVNELVEDLMILLLNNENMSCLRYSRDDDKCSWCMMMMLVIEKWTNFVMLWSKIFITWCAPWFET